MSPRPRTALGGAAAGVVLMAVTWLCAFHVGFLMHADHSILYGFIGLYRPSLDGVTHAIAQLCDPHPYLFLAAVPVIVALLRRRPRVALMIVLVMIGANGSSQLLKPLLADPRGYGLPGPYVNPSSWPSGHATAAMTLVLCAVIAAPSRWRPWVAALMSSFAIAVCYSFLTLDWHFPSDVLGGFELASVWVLLGIAALGWLEQRYPMQRPAVPARAEVPVSEALAPTALLVLCALVAAAAIALAKPAPVVYYAAGHKWFIVGAAVIAAAGVAIACAATLALRRG